MKKIFKSLMAFAAALALPLVLNAQTTTPPKYTINMEKGIGFNKYLVSNTPNENGEYMLHIENFVTGNVEQTTVPTDFVMVLDVSGSMHFDYRPRSMESSAPVYITKDENDAREDGDALKLRLDTDGNGRGYTHYGFKMYYKGGAVGTDGETGYSSYVWARNVTTGTSLTHDNRKNADVGTRWYYHEGDKTFYRLYRSTGKTSSGATCYFIYFKRTNDQVVYLTANGDDDFTTTTTMPTDITDNNDIIFIDGHHRLYKYASRRDALISGVNAFIDAILAQNQDPEVHWKQGVTKHQVAIIAFGANGAVKNFDEPEEGVVMTGGATHVSRIFRPITAENADFYKSWEETTDWMGSTFIYRGVIAARDMLTLLQQQPNMQPLDQYGSANRNKVVVVFTDGEPSNASGFSGYSNAGGSIALSVENGNTIKQTGKTGTGESATQNINGLIYTINLSANTTYVPNFLEHLSSNYSNVEITGGKTGGGAAVTYSGAKDGDGFYMDASSMSNLDEIFKSIVAANTGMTGSILVSMDKVSDSFQIPFSTTDLSKVTMYTAQCIGLTGEKVLDENGNEQPELAFAEPVLVSERRGLEHLWIQKEETVDGKKVLVWHDMPGESHTTMDIDDLIKFKVTDDSTSIIVYGFNYADLWCGLDGIPEHSNNTRQIEADDPNFDKQLDGYRGFKAIYEFPITVNPNALGGVNVPTNDPSSGLWTADENYDPSNIQVPYPQPNLPIPVKLIIQKTGLKFGESANFTVQRRTRTEGSTWEDFTTFVLTGGVATPEVRIINLDPAYFYKVKEGNWSWAYEAVSPEYSTEDTTLKNPIVFENTPEDDTPKHAEAKATNKMRKTGSTTESTD